MHLIAAALQSFAPSGMVDDEAAHLLRCHMQKVQTVLAAHRRPREHADAELIDERGGLEREGLPFPAQIDRGQPAQLAIDDRYDAPSRLRIAIPPFRKQDGDRGLFLRLHSIKSYPTPRRRGAKTPPCRFDTLVDTFRAVPPHSVSPGEPPFSCYYCAEPSQARRRAAHWERQIRPPPREKARHRHKLAHRKRTDHSATGSGPNMTSD